MKTSVIIPNYNYAEFLPFAIESVLAQTENVDEIIVVDDGSTDNSKEVLAGYGDKIITVFQDNNGQASALNNGFNTSTGDIIFLLDADDLFSPEKVETIKNIYKKSPDIAWVFHTLQHKNTHAHDVEPPLPEQPNEEAIDILPIDQRQNMLNGFVDYDAPATSGLSFRRNFLQGLFPLPTAKSVTISDHYIKFYSLSKATGMHLSLPLGSQIIHGDNIYTQQKNADAIKARIFINTAIYLLQINPKIRKFCNSIFEEGIICSQRANIYTEMRPIIDKYYRLVRIYDRFYINFRLFMKKILRPDAFLQQ